LKFFNGGINQVREFDCFVIVIVLIEVEGSLLNFGSEFYQERRFRGFRIILAVEQSKLIVCQLSSPVIFNIKMIFPFTLDVLVSYFIYFNVFQMRV
jgi:hypothetical protein